MHIFTITAGRTGTAWLANLIRENLGFESVHEYLGYDDFGVRTPDIRVMRNFNEKGMTPVVNEFWKNKIYQIAQFENYCETNHTLAKCGILEYLAKNDPSKNILFLNIRRNWNDLAVSYINRGDFNNFTLIWQWYLDFRYRKVIINPNTFLKTGGLGKVLWYIAEVEVRQEYYKRLYPDKFDFYDIRFEDMITVSGATELLKVLGHTKPVRLPEKANANRPRENKHLRARIAEVTEKFKHFDPVDLAEEFIARNRRLV